MKGAQALATSLPPLSGCQQYSRLMVDLPDGVLGSLKRLGGEMLYILPVPVRCPQTPRSPCISPGRLMASLVDSTQEAFRLTEPLSPPTGVPAKLQDPLTWPCQVPQQLPSPLSLLHWLQQKMAVANIFSVY